jgi:hypothetical protein
VGGYAHPLPVADHGLVGEVNDDVHLVLERAWATAETGSSPWTSGRP